MRSMGVSGNGPGALGAPGRPLGRQTCPSVWRYHRLVLLGRGGDRPPAMEEASRTARGRTLDRRSTGHQDTVFVPVASWEENRTTNPEYPCCTFRGSVVALRIKDGSEVWKTYTIAEKAKQTGANEWGPSGAAVWATPTLDTK